jgi:hypothetical protein
MMRRAARRRSQVGEVRRSPGKGYYHVNISLADNKSQVPVTDAR